ncbi:MAG: hypothetical protein SWQ30_12130 [Thermodesulfobacteriota bacterium]|nr:hypothetical protein [Thermodesulfobacteriota bacterium]
MAQITLRGLDPELEQEIRKLAQESGRSLSRTVLDIVYEYAGFKRRKKRPAAHSLRKLAGGWSDKDAAEFLESIRSCEQIDEQVWK